MDMKFDKERRRSCLRQFRRSTENGLARGASWSAAVLCRFVAPHILNLLATFLIFTSVRLANAAVIDDGTRLALPQVGDYQLRIISPTVLELTLITTKEPDPARVRQWDFVGDNSKLNLPAAREFVVSSGSRRCTAEKIGFKRRVLYAPLRQRDLRIANELYLELKEPVQENEVVKVTNPSGRLWPATVQFTAKMDPMRWSPALHVDQLGYLVDGSKKAMVGYFLGSLGELSLSPAGATNETSFSLIDLASNKAVFTGKLKPRRDNGFPFRCYDQVLEADFSAFKTPGEYRLTVAPLGVSFPFWIGESVAAALARTYALGLYHQRCGTNNVLPYTRFTHDPCHIARAAVPWRTNEFFDAWNIIAQKTTDATNDSHHTAPPLHDPGSALYPFVRRGEIDVSGGHHDAGDYSKYTINSALLIHHLMFAVDCFAGVVDLDNLGLPESGDGKGDVLQEAKWEADFLAKLQDDDGGFYFLVYPREREYESEVLPDKGDPQIVWPKTTAATAAAVAALAQCASSLQMKKQFPGATSVYLEKAKKGWAFLEKAQQRFGPDGSYQKLTHYGAEFRDKDELAWATCEMFLATGDQSFHEKLRHAFGPNDPQLRKWSWWRLYEGYGCAIRSYAFAVRAGKLAKTDLDLPFLTKCENEVIAAAEDQAKRAESSAYGTSFPIETKRVRAAGWYFSCDAAFDLAVASQLDYPSKNDPRPRFMEALLSNFNYELGCNPVNVCFLTGLGSKRQREIVHQYAQNDRRVLPPGGIPLGNLQGGFGWLDLYQKELGALSFPPDGDQNAPYPIYDRWGDSFNLSTEFVILNQGRGLAAAAWLLSQTSLKSQPGKAQSPQISLLKTGKGETYELTGQMPDLNKARIVWEADSQQPHAGPTFTWPAGATNRNWVETEALLPDGHFVFAVTNRTAPARLSRNP